MVTLLRKLFIKDYTNLSKPAVRTAHGKMAAIFGIITNLLIAGIKLATAFILASQNAWILPMALVADSINNFSDMGSSIVTLIGFKMSALPADKEHPFGHQRIEYIAGLIVSIIVVVVGVLLFKDSLVKVIDREVSDYDLLAVIILVISILLKFFQSYVNRSLGKLIASEALLATATDSLMDCIATTGIVACAVLSMTLGWTFLDGYVGMVIACFVAYAGVKMVLETASPLIGEKGDKEFVAKVVHDVIAEPMVQGVHDVICHSYGPTRFFVSLHAEVDEKLDVLSIHDAIDNIEAMIKAKYDCEITIHMDPITVGDPLVDALKAKVAKTLNDLNPELLFHDFRVVRGETHINMIFDVVLPFVKGLTKEKVLSTLEKAFKDEPRKCNFVIVFDTPFADAD